MILFEDKCFISIGCSCINQFQLDFYFGIKKPTFAKKVTKFFSWITVFSKSKSAQKKAGLFDWIVASPTSTIQILEAIVSNNVYRLFTDKSNYSIEYGYLKNNAFENLYFWHEDGKEILENDSNFSVFQSKVTHLIDNMLNIANERRCFLLWSNVQPNLKHSLSFRPDSWESFILNEERYDKMTALTKIIFGEDSKCIFICRGEDVDLSSQKLDSIIIIELERSREFRGGADLYAPILNNLLLSSSG
ncbi:MAG: hypothetical protein HOO85_00135 [Methylotenera sp.]|nr:hypothetical protein [Methylotenera sp.]